LIASRNKNKYQHVAYYVDSPAYRDYGRDAASTAAEGFVDGTMNILTRGDSKQNSETLDRIKETFSTLRNSMDLMLRVYPRGLLRPLDTTR